MMKNPVLSIHLQLDSMKDSQNFNSVINQLKAQHRNRIEFLQTQINLQRKEIETLAEATPICEAGSYYMNQY